MPENYTSGGEKPGARDTMDKLTKRLVDHGASPEWAQRKAREAAREWDRNKEAGKTR